MPQGAEHFTRAPWLTHEVDEENTVQMLLTNLQRLGRRIKELHSEFKEQMVAEYETVPGFAARRGWHGNAINDHNYGEPLTAATAGLSEAGLSEAEQ